MQCAVCQNVTFIRRFPESQLICLLVVLLYFQESFCQFKYFIRNFTIKLLANPDQRGSRTQLCVCIKRCTENHVVQEPRTLRKPCSPRLLFPVWSTRFSTYAYFLRKIRSTNPQIRVGRGLPQYFLNVISISLFTSQL